MKKSIFIILLFFIIEFPFSAQAVQSASPQKATYSLEVFSKKQKKLNFLQRVILKKVKRKIARHNGKKKRQPAIPKENLANQSLFFGLGSLLAGVIGGLIIISTVSTLGGLFSSILIFGTIMTILGIIALDKGLKYLDKEKGSSNKMTDDGWNARAGIVLGLIGLLTGVFIAVQFLN